MAELNRHLLADLARLLRRYSPDDWRTLADWLKNDSKRHEAILVLEQFAAVSKTATSRQRGERRPAINRLLLEIRESDPRRADLLRDFHMSLLARDILPTSQDLRFFAGRVGVKDIPAFHKREQGINYIMRELADLPYERLVEVLSQAADVRRDLGEEYERWVGLILKGTRPES
jgi:hypothetical protein